MTLRFVARAIVLLSLFAAVVAGTSAQTPSSAGPKAPVHAKQVKRLLITGAMVIPGTGVPASGPTDILVDDGRIAWTRQRGGRQMARSRHGDRRRR